jgi:acetyl esterase/lipase
MKAKIIATVLIAASCAAAERAVADDARRPERSRKVARAKQDDKPAKDEKDKPDEPAGGFEVVAEKNIAYRTDPGADQLRHRLDLYLPKGQRNFPVVMFVHGGGWHSGSKEMYSPMGRLLARNGLGAVVINYRLTPQVQHPGHIEDVAKAFAWVHHNISRYGGRADRVILFGHSAGGHLVSLLATDERYLRAEGLGLADIRGVVSISGAYDIDSIYGLYPSVFSSDRAARREASPRYYVSNRCPPFLLLYAEKDLPTVAKESEKFFDVLRETKADARVQMLKNRTHVSVILLMAKEGDTTTDAVFEFVERRTEWKRPTTANPTEGKP